MLNTLERKAKELHQQSGEKAQKHMCWSPDDIILGQTGTQHKHKPQILLHICHPLKYRDINSM